MILCPDGPHGHFNKKLLKFPYLNLFAFIYEALDLAPLVYCFGDFRYFGFNEGQECLIHETDKEISELLDGITHADY
jgi:hypothetical protein